MTYKVTIKDRVTNIAIDWFYIKENEIGTTMEEIKNDKHLYKDCDIIVNKEVRMSF